MVQSEKKSKKQYIYWLKCLAVMLVLNSHLDNIYPISALAVGGGWVIPFFSV